MNRTTIALAFVAGLAGGMLSHYLSPEPVHAQALTPKEVRAGSYVLVNEKGTVLATLSDDNGRPCFRLFDDHGREIWSAGGRLGLRSPFSGK